MNARKCLLPVAAIVACLLPQLCGAVATNLNLSPPMNRTVELEQNVDPQEWAESNGIDDPQVRQRSDGSAAIDFYVPDHEWEKRKQQLCNIPGVLSCGDNHCRVFLGPDPTPFTGQVADMKGGPVAGAKIILVPKAPEVSEFLEDEGSQQQTDADARKTPGSRRCDYSGIDSEVGPIQYEADGSGNFKLALPGGQGFEPSCWELVSGDSCEATNMPLPAIMPTFEPGKILALLKMPASSDPTQMRQLANDIAANADLKLLEVTPIESADAALVRFEAQPNFDEETIAMNLRVDPRVEDSQPDYHYRTMTENTDPFAWMNYGAAQIRAEQLPAGTNGSGVTIAVIDTGVDGTHAELSGKVVEQIDVSGFGTAPDRHGTAIAGIIAAEPNNGVGAFGIAPAAKILSIKACEPGTRNGVDARCWSSTVAKALDRALRADAPIITMSLGGPPDPLVERLIDKAVEQGRLVIAAAGNDGPNANPPFPAAHRAVMAVTAVDAGDNSYRRAVQGEFVDVAAPGVEIPVPVPGESYPGQLTGTSMATAYAAGSAALLMSMDRQRSAAEIRTSLESGAADLGPEARDEIFGQGRIDLCTAATLQSESGINPCK